MKLFIGEVSEVRLQPNESSNVITYTVIVEVANPELKLKPGMTASITDYVEEANDVLVIAGKAIRFTPTQQLLNDYRSQIIKMSKIHHQVILIIRKKKEGLGRLRGEAGIG